MKMLLLLSIGVGLFWGSIVGWLLGSTGVGIATAVLGMIAAWLGFGLCIAAADGREP